MYAILASLSYKNIIRAAIGSIRTTVYESYGAIDIRRAVNKIGRLNISMLILQTDVASATEIHEAVKKLKVMRPNTRIILIAPGCKPGDSLIASLVAKGVYDILCPDLEEDFRYIAHSLQLIINGPPASYADAARWDISTLLVREKEIATVPVITAIVVNMAKRAGSTFVSTSLAAAINDCKIISAVIEVPTKPHLFDALGLALLEQKGTDFYSYPHAIAKDGQTEAGKEFSSDGVIWLVPDSREGRLKKWNYSQMIRLLYCCKHAGALIVDVGDFFREDYVDLLMSAVDIVIAVIDPLPTQIIQSEKRIERMIAHQKKGVNVVYVVNKWCAGIRRSDFLKLVNVKPRVYIPVISSYDIYQAAYACRIPYALPAIKKQLKDPLSKIVRLLLPANIQNNIVYQHLQT